MSDVLESVIEEKDEVRDLQTKNEKVNEYV